MGFLDKAKAAAEQAATKAKEGVDDVQTKRELSQAYNELGKTAYELIESGDLSHPRLVIPGETTDARVGRRRQRAGQPGRTSNVDELDPHAQLPGVRQESDPGRLALLLRAVTEPAAAGHPGNRLFQHLEPL